MRGSGKIIFWISILAALFLVYVHGRVMLLHVSYSINSQSRSMDQKTEQYRYLKFQVDQLKAPRLLENKMKDLAIDLMPPKEIKVVRMPEMHKLVEGGTATVAEQPMSQRLNNFLGRWVGVAQAKTDN
jgi:hypothetical protein